MPSAQGRIPAYFSHSYRPEDRGVNQFFWKLFWNNDFSFTVDPESDNFSIPHLELMMRWSACFVAVATHRPQQKFYKSSPFIAYEYGLAVRAQKPRLVFVESGVTRQYFPEDSVVCAFDRKRLEDRRDDFIYLIEQLGSKSRAYASIGDRPRGPAGLLLPATTEYREAKAAIGKLLAAAGHEPRELNLSFDNFFQFALQLDECDFAVIDIGSTRTPSWIYPFLQGRFIPTVRLQYQSSRHNEPKKSLILDADEALRAEGVNDELVIRWRTLDDLTTQLERHVEKLFQPREPFQSEKEGDDYFRNLGRREVSIFISNAGSENRFASSLVRGLSLENIRPFHYVYENPLELGKDWRDSLRAKLQSSQLFVPLISKDYWKSEWCEQEYELAERLSQRGMLDIYPYFLDETRGRLVASEGRRLSHLTVRERVSRIVRDIDNYLISERSVEEHGLVRRPAESASFSSRRLSGEGPAVDIAILTVLPEEHSAVRDQLMQISPAPGTSEHPNLYSWEFGEIASDQYRASYSVVLGIAGLAGEGSGLLAVIDTIQAFSPDYVVLVGVAGGLGDINKGDVVVSDHIFGYEYGKIDSGFRPRSDWTFSADRGLANAARTWAARNPGWAQKINIEAPDGTADPQVRIGTVASGNKVVDDISDPSFRPVLDHWPQLRAVEMEGLGAAQAIEWAREKGLAVNFSMVRGISDLPRNAPSGAAPMRSDVASTQTRERDLWKKYASESAAVLTTQIIRQGWRKPPRQS
jgi:nucleoside phosphorylase